MIRFALQTDIPAIMQFIETYWKSGHILGNDVEFFCYEFVKEEVVNVVISVNSDGVIDGIEGFIPYGSQNRDIMLVMWKVRKGNTPVLGLEILEFIMKNSDAKSVSSPGINPKTIGIYQYMGFAASKMTQWYRLNKKETYRIAKVLNDEIPQSLAEQQYGMKLFETFDELKKGFDFETYYARNPKPLKEDWYIEKRYFKHPIYSYKVLGIVNMAAQIETLIVFRMQEHDSCYALRFIDVIGKYENIYYITDAIDSLMEQFDAEYVDFYEIGLSQQQMEKAGWKKVRESGNIIPNYFSPYVQKNIEIAYCAQDSETVLFKGDGDQDRPNERSAK